MNDKAKIASIYIAVAVVGVFVVSISMFLRKRVDRGAATPIVGKQEQKEARVYTTLEKPISFLNQEGEPVTLGDLKGKVWVFVQFYAACPQCAKRNYLDLQKLHEKYKGHPDFRLVCVTVNPQKDTVELMKNYADALEAPKESWLFLTGAPEEILPYMEEEFKYPSVKMREDESEIAEKGEIAHDLSLAVFDRELQMRGKYDIFSARDSNENVYQLMKQKLNAQLKEYLGN